MGSREGRTKAEQPRQSSIAVGVTTAINRHCVGRKSCEAISFTSGTNSLEQQGWSITSNVCAYHSSLGNRRRHNRFQRQGSAAGRTARLEELLSREI
jgi:hypothetical protein